LGETVRKISKINQSCSLRYVMFSCCFLKVVKRFSSCKGRALWNQLMIQQK